ncbi:receptor-like protein 45 [Venturia canescens]|uniref:receptor-like protein 45 n=1 Tax=Venturia canescens TaxID=32260 RepID=UPI001C9BCFFF|nr:receptor-like protein 45 [Venturia canescens]
MACHQNYRDKSFLVRFATAIVILGFLNQYRAWDHDYCPDFCQCFFLYGLKWADCTGHRVYSVQIGIDDAVQALDLSNNSVSSLSNYELRDAGLTKLKLLNLSSNAINEIGSMAFVDLSQLRVLDLSRNHLYSLLPDTFITNKRLEVLELADNNLDHRVPKLKSSSLGSLDLSNCGIGHLAPDTFDGLPHLRALDLSNNVMIQLELDFSKGLQHLAVLVIEKNPWSCNEQMSNLQKRLKTRGVSFEKVCNDNKSKESHQVPKKMEKMTMQDKNPQPETDRNSDRLLAKVKRLKNSTKTQKSPNQCLNKVPSKEILRDSVSSLDISPYCFLAVGFLVGSALSTVVTYLWLTRKSSRSSVEREAIIDTESSEAANQRANLLQYFWQNNDESARSSILCPGTPPPPYRDVILHSHRYPRPGA